MTAGVANAPPEALSILTDIATIRTIRLCHINAIYEIKYFNFQCIIVHPGRLMIEEQPRSCVGMPGDIRFR